MQNRTGADHVQLQVFKRPNGDNYLKVSIRSEVKKGQIAERVVEAPFTDYEVQLSAGACAEYLGVHFGDNIDPDAAARTALKGLKRLRKILAEPTRH